MATSSFDREIVIRDTKAANIIIEGLTRPVDESKLPKYIDIEEEIERGKELLKRIYCR